ncbi:MAG: PQQ-like beta-propeller repeat protein [Gemmataceae bacterium]|nr:PQQ-like beta-propeller repeat protein [Gemmataceae bacterium]
MRNVLTVLVALTAWFWLVPSTGADNFPPGAEGHWHQWRGPLATGMAPKGNPPLKWDEQTNVRWKVALPGKGSSTPVVWGDRVFVLTAVATNRKARPEDLPKPDTRFERKTEPPRNYYKFLVLCLDRNTGKVLWERTAAEQVPHEGAQPTHSYAASSALTDGQRVYAFFGSRGLYCYDLDGKLLWQRDLGKMATRYAWGEGASPAVYKDWLVVPWDQEGPSFLYALDPRTGETRWKVARDEPTTWTTPLIVPHKGQPQVVMCGTHKARGYDLATGKVLWECGPLTVNAIPSPVSADGVVYCMAGYRGAAAYAVPLDARGDLSGTNKLAWQLSKGTPYIPSPLLDGDRLYFTQSNTPMLSCVDVKTGKVLIDRVRLRAVDSFYASPAGAAGRLYFVGRDGTTVVIRRSDKVEVLAVNRLDQPIDASPVIVGRQLLLRSHGHLYCLEDK